MAAADQQRMERELLERLNACVGVSARRVFQQEAAPSRLLQRPQSETQRLLPELCGFVAALGPASARPPPIDLVRRVFRHPQAQWLSRSARQSGVSALVSQQLLRLASTTSNGAAKNGVATNTYCEAVVHVVVDALLAPCAQRLGGAPTACAWLATQHKPRFHAMPCFPVWTALLPFAAQLGVRYPRTFQRVLLVRRRPHGPHQPANCDFAHVTGLWRLLDALNAGSTRDGDAPEPVTDLMVAVLRFMTTEKLLLSADGIEAALFNDLLLDKFFSGLQEFSFTCWRASAVAKPALLGALLEALEAPESQASAVVTPSVAIFSAVAGVFVKNLASELATALIKRLKDEDGAKSGALLAFVVSFCAHVELVPLAVVFELLDLLLDRYKARLTAASAKAEPQERRRLLFFVVYVALHRRQAVDSLRNDISAESALPKELLVQFQLRVCGEIEYEDLHVVAPVHWMAALWKHWVLMSDEDVAAFVAEAQGSEHADDVESLEAAWRAWRAPLVLHSTAKTQFPRMQTLLRPHWSVAMSLTESEDDEDLGQARKRRRTASTRDLEQDELTFDVLLLPDVMELVCSFMSAKRLCRMALVCRAFAELSHRATLWRPLYVRLGFVGDKQEGAEPPARIECQHGELYEHNWRFMYRERWQALRRLRRRQRRLVEAQQSEEQEDQRASDDRDMSPSAPSNAFSPQLCSWCDCHRMLSTRSDLTAHRALHRRLTCREASCRASFTVAAKYKQHVRQAHLDQSAVSSTSSSTKAESAQARLACGFEGCTKSYTSAKWLASHRQQKGHVLDDSIETTPA
ncbi:hypothetical protein BBJ28_00009426 [Nothophytophthora sp. Chile5]|nr:hypothetical protein BBJ28_00009426 [Nothophytophthora sp. Chile5]